MIDAVEAQKWFFRPSLAARPRFRLFCVPYAGGGASIFSDWQSQLPDSVEVWPVQLPGRQSRLSEPPLRCIEDIVNALAPAAQRHLDVPYGLFGHSLGALICFELARRIRRRGAQTPRILFASGHRAPQLRNANMRYHLLDEQAFLRAISQLNGIPESIRQNDDLLRLVIPALRADFEAAETYRYVEEESLTCSISTLGGEDDPVASTEDLLAWRAQTSEHYSFHPIPGDHFFINNQASEVLRVISGEIARVLKSETWID